MKKKMLRYFKKVQRFFTKWIIENPDIIAGIKDMEKEDRHALYDAMKLMDDSMEMSLAYAEKLDRIENSLDYIIEKLG